MKGFEINVNEKIINSTLNSGVVIVTIKERCISIIGQDNTLGVSLDWGKTKLFNGDTIKIIASDNTINSTPPVNVKSLDRQELLTEYYKLKDLLIKNGMLK